METTRIVAEHFNGLAKHYAKYYNDRSPGGYFFLRRLSIVCGLLNNYHSAKILDLGCGPGMMAEYCLNKGLEFFGIDISDVMIEECNRKFGGSDAAHFSVSDFQKLDFPDQSFDVILCMGALEYIAKSKDDSTIAEIVRVLKPDGIVIFSLLNEKNFYNRNRRIGWRVKALLRKATGYGKNDNLPLAKNTRLFGENYARALLSSHNLHEIDCIYFCINLSCPFIENRFPKLSLKSIKMMETFSDSTLKRWRLRWAYRAFIISARRSPKDAS